MLKVSKLSFSTLHYRAQLIDKFTKGLKFLWTVIKWILIAIGVLIAAQIIGYSIGYGIGSAIINALQSTVQQTPLIS